MPLSGPGTFDSFFGAAPDGDANFTTPAGGLLAQWSCFGTVSVGGPIGLDLGDFPLFCHQLIVDSSDPANARNGAIHCNGQDATPATPLAPGLGARSGFFGGGGNGGVGGVPPTVVPTNGLVPAGVSIGGAGGDGGLSVSGPNGTGGIPQSLPPGYNRILSFITALTGLFITPSGLVVPCGGAGGGGGGRIDGATAAFGGAGGGGGGVVFVCAREIVVRGANPHFAARGGDGAAGGVGGAGGGGGGGGGGAGGIILVTARLTGNLVTNAKGGGGGGSAGQPGRAGGDGSVFFYPV
jgi:hypothetical protein